MKIVRESPTRGAVRPADAARARVSRPVHGAVHDRRLAADVLHDIDLARLRPTDSVDVVAEHPERRPQTLPARNTDARLEAAVRLGEEPFGLDPRRGVA